MTEQERKDYISFMCNAENSHNCDVCPENMGADDWQGRKPCGQWNCWVDCHCRQGDDYEI